MPRPQPSLQEVQSLIASGRSDDAEAMLTQLLRREPHAIPVRLLASQFFAGRGDHARAESHARAILDANPRDASGLRVLASVLSALGRHNEAAAALATLTELDASDGRSWCVLANELLLADRLDDAESALDRAVTHAPSHAPCWRDRAQLLLATGRSRESAETLDRSLITHPRDAGLAQFLASTLNYVSDVSPERVAKAHALAARLFEADIRHAPHTNAPHPDRALRIGFLSPDLHAHSVSYFLLPLVEHLDPAALVPHFFWTGKKDDARTERYRRAAGSPDAWHACRTLSTLDLCALIRRVGIDVLVDLSGHTTGNAMPAFARKPAPIQISAIGYPNSTGLRSIDARLGDSIVDPPSLRADEPLLRVDPCFLCYQPPESSDEDAPRIDDPDRPPTFGSFNAIQKLNPALLDLWAELLRSTPGSRLVFKADLRLSALAERLIDAFTARGIDRSRLTLLSHAPTPAAGRRHYASIDVALDTFPYNGTTTTCEALWMGVPVVTTPGHSHASRVSASILHAIGLDELVARDPADYVRVARELVRDRARINTLRHTLRTRMLDSPLCDAPAYARSFESAIRGLWRAWCMQAAR